MQGSFLKSCWIYDNDRAVVFLKFHRYGQALKIRVHALLQQQLFDGCARKKIASSWCIFQSTPAYIFAHNQKYRYANERFLWLESTIIICFPDNNAGKLHPRYTFFNEHILDYPWGCVSSFFYAAISSWVDSTRDTPKLDPSPRGFTTYGAQIPFSSKAAQVIRRYAVQLYDPLGRYLLLFVYRRC